MVAYDAGIIQQFADWLYRRAKAIVISSTIVGALFGGLLGLALGAAIAVPISQWREGGLDLAVLGRAYIAGVIGALFFGLLAFMSSRQRAFLLRLQAQIALCQVRIEENTRK